MPVVSPGKSMPVFWPMQNFSTLSAKRLGPMTSLARSAMAGLEECSM